MPYIAVKPRKIAGTIYARGEVVDTSTISISRMGSLLRAGLIIQADQAEATGINPSDTFCATCGGGPYKRLDLHTKTHKE